MAAKTKHSSEDFNAAVIARAVGYRVHLFLGRGEYDRADASSEAEARDIAAQMKAAHPTVLQSPMIYATDAAGRSALLTSAQEPKAMIKAAKKTPEEIRAAKGARGRARVERQARRHRRCGRARRIAGGAGFQRGDA